jgi:hypothetical protein
VDHGLAGADRRYLEDEVVDLHARSTPRRQEHFVGTGKLGARLGAPGLERSVERHARLPRHLDGPSRSREDHDADRAAAR